MTKSSPASIDSVLHRARTLGFLGPGPIRAHIDHAKYFQPYILTETSKVLDLGSGGGLPGLPLAIAFPAIEMVLLDASTKRCDFLEWAILELNLGGRVTVVAQRAEEAAHLPPWRKWADLVVSRSFAAPHHAIECGMGLVRTGGRIVLSEPPGGRNWPIEELGSLGLKVESSSDHTVSFTVTKEIAETLPRRFKKQARGPLFVV